MLENITFNDAADATYCEKLASRFASMGIAPKASEVAIASMVKKDAVPDFIPRAATPAMFPTAKATATTTFATFEGDLALQA